MTRVSPDKDVQPTGQFGIYYATATMSAIYSPEGAFLRSMSTKRIETLPQAYWNTTSLEMGDFPQAIAKLVARYKDGSKSGTHHVAYKNCYSAPPSHTLTSALGATTELVATPFALNPNMKHNSAPFAEDGELGAYPAAFFLFWQGSCFCHPESSHVQMLKTLQWALA